MIRTILTIVISSILIPVAILIVMMVIMSIPVGVWLILANDSLDSGESKPKKGNFNGFTRYN